MRRQQGFTLIEASVAIAVVALLSGVIAPMVINNVKQAQIARAASDVQSIATVVSAQLKDTGARPSAALGPGGATGATAFAAWYSGPALAAATGSFCGAFVAANTFLNLFTPATGTATCNVMFALPAYVAGKTSGSYLGPYMGETDALKVDPWGNPYEIIGYNVSGGTTGSLYVVCLGPDGATLAANSNNAALPANWTITAGSTSADDIIARVM